MSKKVCKYPADIPKEVRRREVPEGVPLAVSLAEIAEQIRVSGGWVPKKPDRTVYNFGYDIKNKVLPPGAWTKIFTLPAEYGPYIVHWKTLVADTPQIICLPYMDGSPVSPNGIDLRDLYDNGVWQANDRIWCHIYDTVNSRYGLMFNVVEPVVGDYDFYIRNDDTVQHTLTYLYVKWYQWAKKRFLKVT